MLQAHISYGSRMPLSIGRPPLEYTFEPAAHIYEKIAGDFLLDSASALE